jgi:hypothetical protein
MFENRVVTTTLPDFSEEAAAVLFNQSVVTSTLPVAPEGCSVGVTVVLIQRVAVVGGTGTV